MTEKAYDTPKFVEDVLADSILMLRDDPASAGMSSSARRSSRSTTTAPMPTSASGAQSGRRKLKKAVVLLSGGLDSATTAAIAKSEGYELYAISFDYGQRHARELESAKAVAKSLGRAASDRVLRPARDRRERAHGRYRRADGPAQRGDGRRAFQSPTCRRETRSFSRSRWAMRRRSARSTSSSASARWTTAAIPTAAPEFIEAFEQMANLATKAGVEGQVKFKIHAPLDRSEQGRDH